jgi:hypothetical protein
VIAGIGTLILILVGDLFPAIGTATAGSVSLLLSFLAWRFPRPDPSSGKSSEMETITLGRTGTANLPASNPFQALASLPDSEHFHGRKSELHTLIERTRSRKSTSIVGPRRIGKTWMLQYLTLVAPADLGRAYRIVTIDGLSAQFPTVIEFVGYVLQKLKDQTKSQETKARQILESALIECKQNPNKLAILERTIQRLFSMGIITVLRIDEFTGIARYKKEFNLDFFRSLRAMASDENTNLVLVIASQIPLQKTVGKVGHESGFFNIFHNIPLRPFNLDEAEEFVQSTGDEARFDDLERDYLLKLGLRGKGLRRKHWPVLLEEAGNLLWEKKLNDKNYSQLSSKTYWRKLKKEMAEIEKNLFKRG